MKKLVYVLIALLLALVLVPSLTLAHTADDPLVVPLLAGQTDPIGEVHVWNDADNLYVKFKYTGPDCGFLEVHLQVDEGAFSEDILTKKGNPIPGQFEKSFSGSCFKEHTFTYVLADEGFAPDDNLLIAAHAALGVEEVMAIVSGDGQTMVTQRRSGNAPDFTPVNQAAALAWEPGPAYPNDGPDDSGWEQNSLWDQRLSTDLRPTGADWIWESYRVLDPVNGTVLTFQRIFDIGWPKDGNLLIACDNGYEVLLNGMSLGSDNVYGVWRTSDLTQPFVDVNGWDAVGSYPLLDYLLAGTNILTIDAANEYFNPPDQSNSSPGTISSNPGACIFAMDLIYYAGGETAWGDGDPFPGKNWATYLTYIVQEVCLNEPDLVNGGFESPAVTTSQGWDIYDSGTAGLGWTVEWYLGSTSYGGWTRPEPAHLELHKSGTVVNAYEGDQYAELDTDWDGPGGGLNGEPASVKIYQVLATCPGQDYTLTYAWRGRPGYTSALQVNFADYSGSHSENSGQWNIVEVTATATDSTTTLEFTETGPADSFGMFLDAVSVTECDSCMP